MKNTIRVAVLDMYDGTPNQGMANIRTILSSFPTALAVEYFDVRGEAEVPDTSFDIYISTGGPGSPHDGDGLWDRKYYRLLQDIWDLNNQTEEKRRHVLFICHSFQMACIHFRVGEVIPRRSMSFGIFPTHKTDSGKKEPLFDSLPDPFYVADFRKWQVVQPDLARLEELGAEILALEKIRSHVPLKRAVMAVRFSEEFIGVQFHPEADPKGMLAHFTDEDRMEEVVREHGREKYDKMIDCLMDPARLSLTYKTVIPYFLKKAVSAFSSPNVPVSETVSPEGSPE